jgi:hypothetical protein
MFGWGFGESLRLQFQSFKAELSVGLCVFLGESTDFHNQSLKSV